MGACPGKTQAMIDLELDAHGDRLYAWAVTVVPCTSRGVDVCMYVCRYELR